MRRGVLGVAAVAASAALTVCNDDGGKRLEPVSDCKSHDACVDADARYDQCQFVCEGQITYCVASCETDDDCRGRGLPDGYVYCDVPRPGEGFCNPYHYDYKPDDCVQTTPELD